MESQEFNIKKILVPINSAAFTENLQHNIIFWANKTKAEVILLGVIDGADLKPEEKRFDPSTHDHIMFDGTEVLDTINQLNSCKTVLLGKGLPTVSYIIERGHIYKKVAAVARRIEADAIMIDHKGKQDEGSKHIDVFKVISEAPCPVISIKNHPSKDGIKNIFIPFQDKPHSRESIEYGIHLAEIYDATLNVLGISYDTSEEGVKKMQLEADQIKHILEERKVKNTTEVVEGNYDAQQIDCSAKEYNADIVIVMADLDKRSVTEYIIGPVLEQLVNNSEISLMTVRPRYNPHILDSETEPESSVKWKFWE